MRWIVTICLAQDLMQRWSLAKASDEDEDKEDEDGEDRRRR